jgi:hypothetical protein
MAEDRLDIDSRTLEDNPDLRQVEFEGEVSDERYQFAVQYSVLEALSAEFVGDDAIAIFKQHKEEIAQAALSALARDLDEEIITVSENDLE